MKNKILELYDLIKRNDVDDWATIDALLNAVSLDEVTFEIIYETIAQSCHFENFYRNWC